MDPHARRVVRAWAAFDLMVTALLVLPPGVHLFLTVLGLGSALLPGSPGLPAPALDPLGMLFTNLAGVLGVLWALVRLARPERFLGLTDAAARLSVAILISAHVALAGLPWALLAFVASELAGAIHQGLVLRERG